MKKIHIFFSILISFLLVTSVYAQENPFSTAPKYRTTLAPLPLEDIVEIHYDGENFDAIGLTAGGTFEVAARFTPTQLGILTGGQLQQVKLYINDLPSPATLKIYGNGTPTAPGPILHQQPLTGLTALSWNTINLTSFVTIDGLDLWVAYEVTHTAGTFPAGCDAGPANPNGDWIYFSGTWQHLAALGLNYNWNIRALIEEPGGGPGAATNPSPANGATGVSVNLASLSWTNPAGVTGTEVIFNGATVYSGAPTTTYNIPGTLAFNTTYTWRVRSIDGTGTSNGPVWSFTTAQNPNLAICDDFSSFNWTIIGPLGLTNWSQVATNNAGGSPGGELRFSWTPSFVGESKILSAMVTNASAGTPIDLSFRHMVDWYSTTFTLGVGYTTDGGTNVTTLWTISPTGSIPAELVTVPTFNSPGNFQFVIYFSGDSFEINYWYIDDFCGGIVPVELTSFTASALNGAVNLNWSTATETNNAGFEVQRKVGGGEFASVAFVEGKGTTTQIQSYTFTDNGLSNGTYTYRLKQVDLDGTFEYSSEVEADVSTPSVFTLNQNYPNPFNPSTAINFSLAVDSKVSLKVFDVLGQEVANLVNTNIAAGSHTVNFDASSLNSGVYFYQIEANGIDGTNFSSVKKMMLTK
jgi:hypothetical protein